jgi:hypothetical protein
MRRGRRYNWAAARRSASTTSAVGREFQTPGAVPSQEAEFRFPSRTVTSIPEPSGTGPHARRRRTARQILEGDAGLLAPGLARCRRAGRPARCRRRPVYATSHKDESSARSSCTTWRAWRGASVLLQTEGEDNPWLPSARSVQWRTARDARPASQVSDVSRAGWFRTRVVPRPQLADRRRDALCSARRSGARWHRREGRRHRCSLCGLSGGRGVRWGSLRMAALHAAHVAGARTGHHPGGVDRGPCLRRREPD